MISTRANLRRLLTSRAATTACRRRLSQLPTATRQNQRVFAATAAIIPNQQSPTAAAPAHSPRHMSTHTKKIIQHHHHHDYRQTPSMILCNVSTTDSEESRQIYDEWAPKYEQDMRSWGWDMPEQVAQLIAKYVKSRDTKYVPHKMSILDAGAGDGLAGMALRQHPGFDKSQAFMIGADYSAQMLQVAASRKVYDAVIPSMNLNTTPFCNNKLSQAFLDGCNASTAVNIFDAILCVGTMTYINPKAGTLREFCRWVKPGGYICYTNRTDLCDDFRPQEQALEEEGVWSLVEKVGPLPYLPGHPDYGDDIQAYVYLYQKTAE